MPALIDISDIIVDPEIQPRETLSDQTVDNIVSDLEDGIEYDAVDVFTEDDQRWLAHGFHRMAAYKKTGKTKIACNVHEGGKDRAAWFALSCNQKSSTGRTRADKRRIVLRAFEIDPKRSSPEIARHCGVSETFVRQLRKGTKGESPWVAAEPKESKPKKYECRNCGGTERDEDGACVDCYEPADPPKGKIKIKSPKGNVAAEVEASLTAEDVGEELSSKDAEDSIEELRKMTGRVTRQLDKLGVFEGRGRACIEQIMRAIRELKAILP